MRDQGVGSWIDRRARLDPHRLALIGRGRTWTNAQFADRINGLAHGLRDVGVERGDRVAWLGPNHPAFLEALFAVAKLGAILAPVNHRLDATAVAGVLRHCDPRLAIASERVIESIPADVPLVVVREAETARREATIRHGARPSGDRLGGGPGPGGPEILDFGTLTETPSVEPVDEEISLDDVCMLPHTSGTTGAPKGVMLTHAGITWNALNMITATELRADDVTVAIAPFFRVGGTGVNVLPVLLKGGAVVVPDSTEPGALLRLMAEHRITVGFANPDLLEALARSDHFPGADLSSLRFVITGGAPVPERLLDEYQRRDVSCLQGYGLSEAGPVVMLLPPEHALDRIGSAGKPVTFCDVRLVRPDGTGCGPGETGELLVRGPALMSGYWHDRDATAAAVDGDGWLHTGDAARVDADGFYQIVGRVSEAFRTDSGIVHPGDIERVLLAHPDVLDAAALGVPDTAGRLRPHAVVVAEADTVTAAVLAEWCSRQLPAPAVPVSIRFVHAVPRNSVGKIVRAELRGLLSGRAAQALRFGSPQATGSGP